MEAKRYPEGFSYTKCPYCKLPVAARFLSREFIAHMVSCPKRGKDAPEGTADPDKRKWSPFVSGGLPGLGKKK